MPDTKSGREEKGLNKQEQLRRMLYERELETLDSDDDLPSLGERADGEFVAVERPDG